MVRAARTAGSGSWVRWRVLIQACRAELWDVMVVGMGWVVNVGMGRGVLGDWREGVWGSKRIWGRGGKGYTEV